MRHCQRGAAPERAGVDVDDGIGQRDFLEGGAAMERTIIDGL
jgi:hypothetical protein